MNVSPDREFGNHSHNHQVALDLAAHGVRVFPCRPADGPPDNDGHPKWRAKQPMPRVKWTVQATTDPLIINAWWFATPDALVGMPLEPLGILILDPDQHPGAPDGIAAYNALAVKYPELLNAPYVQTPQGKHYLFEQTVPPHGNGEGTLPPGINVRGKGGYVIAPGTILPDGRGWVMHNPNGDAPRQLPLAIIDMLRGAQPQPDPDPETFKQAAWDFDDLTLPSEPRRAAYLMASCRNAYDKICNAKPGTRNNTLNTQAVKLGHFIGAGLLVEAEITTLLTEAAIQVGLDEAEIGPTIRSGLAKGKSEPNDPIDVANEFWDGDIPDPEPDAKQPTDRVWNATDLWDIPRSTFLIDGMIPDNALGLMVGETQTFKSFIAQSIALAIAAGLKDWQGHAIRAPQGAIVLYIAGEGGIESAALRMRAWATQHGLTRDTLGDRFHLIPWSINLLDKKSVQRLIKACNSIVTDTSKLALIVIDTINTASTGSDENSSQDMGILYTVMRRLAAIYTTAIMGVHHTNKRGGTRGSNLLSQNADFTLFLKRTMSAWPTMNVELQITKLKDAPSGTEEKYHLDLIALPDGTTSLAPKRIGAVQAERTETVAAGRPSSRADAILDVLRRSAHIDGETPTEICNILDITEGWEKRAVTKCLRRLLGQGIVIRDGNKWTIVDDGGGFLD
jgi:hypothetical protein